MPQAHALPLADGTAAATPNAAECFVLPFPTGTTLKEIEKAAILTTLAWEDGNQSKTAKSLGIGRRTLHNKLRDYNEET